MYTKPFTVDRKQKDEHLGMLKGGGHLNLSNIYKIQRFMIDIKAQTLHIRFYTPQTGNLIQCVLNIGSIRIYILTTGVVSNETNTYVRMYIEEFILVDIWIHWS